MLFLQTILPILFIGYVPSALADLLDLGFPNYDCPGNVMNPSKTVPINVNSLRPADIKVVMALGDSITAGNGAGAEDPVAVILQYRGLAFNAGGDKSLEEHATIPNILRKYNPNLFGQSYGIGAPNVWQISYLNAAVPGANAKDMPSQARTLVSQLKEHQESINFEKDWKLLNIFIGGNDACGVCKHSNYAADICVQNITDAIQVIYDNVPRVIVSITTMLHVDMLRKSDANRPFCKRLHEDECGCEQNQNFTDAQLSQYCVDYANGEIAIETSGKFEKEDFTVTVQPFMRDVTDAPPRQFFAPDCFHFSQWGHALVTSWLWKNMLEPANNKTTMGSLNDPLTSLDCPDPACPFIRTTFNSEDCSKFMTPAADYRIQA